MHNTNFQWVLNSESLIHLVMLHSELLNVKKKLRIFLNEFYDLYNSFFFN